MTPNTYRNIAFASLFFCAAFLTWVTIGPFDFPGAPVVACFTMAMVFIILKVGRKVPLDHWKNRNHSNQIPRVLIMIGTTVIVHLTIIVLMNEVNAAFLSDRVVAIATWGGLAFAFIASGFVKWPQRITKLQHKEFFIVATITIASATSLSLLRSNFNIGLKSTENIVKLTDQAAQVISLATLEEIFFRVLLMTALLQASGSRIVGLVLSSIAFAMMHAPYALTIPIVNAEWSIALEIAYLYSPDFIMQLSAGFILGALWLRTGSIPLIAITHAILNIPAIISS